MMKLDIQIITLLFSMVYGIIFSSFIDLIKNKILKFKMIFQMLIFLVITLLFSLIYFYFLLKLNNAIIHPYFVISFIFGFIIEIALKKVFKRIVLSIKKWYNSFGG